MEPMLSERIEFPGSQGALLAGRFDRPALPTRVTALFAHCFTCSKDIAAASRISKALALKGIAVLRFDFTGLGHSGGEFANSNFSSNVEDLVHAAAWLREHHQAPQLLVGHSLGGAAVLAAAGRIEEAAAVATIGAPDSPEHVAELFTGSRAEIERTGEAEVQLAGRSFRIRKQFLDDISEHNLIDRLSGLRKSLLVMHAVTDNVVGIENARRIFEAAKHPKSFVSLDQADHLLTRARDARYVADVLAAWVGGYVDTSDSVDGGVPAPAAGDVVVEETGAGKYLQRVRVGEHEFLADEPASVGGLDAGPSPYDLLVAALGACTSMTLRMYAEHKGIALKKVEVALRHAKIHAADCEECETKQGRIDLIERDIRLTGELSDAQRARLMEIADRCPVHRTLQSETRIKTRELSASAP